MCLPGETILSKSNHSLLTMNSQSLQRTFSPEKFCPNEEGKLYNK